MVKRICESINCTGCMNCVKECPQDAVLMVKDFMGFSYPQICESLCIACGVCSKVCHVQTPVEKSDGHCYCYSGDREIQKNSSSGGFIPLLIEACLEKGFYICGVVFSKDFTGVKYVITRSKKQILKMRKSKYIEADLGNIFLKVKHLTDRGERVLFVGLPCQVAALKKYLKDTSLVLMVDLICHGNGSPQYFKKSLEELCRKYNTEINKITGVDFRPKPEQVGKKEFLVEFEGDVLRVSAKQFPYYYGYIERLLLRNACYDCRYVGMERVGDITTGDSTFSNSIWGENVVMCNSQKGEMLVEELKEKGGFRGLTEEEIKDLAKRVQLKPSPKYRKKIARDIEYAKLERTYLSYKYVPLKYKIKRYIIDKKEKLRCLFFLRKR